MGKKKSNVKQTDKNTKIIIAAIAVVMVIFSGILIYNATADKDEYADSSKSLIQLASERIELYPNGQGTILIDEHFTTEAAFNALKLKGHFSHLDKEDLMVLESLFGKKVDVELKGIDGADVSLYRDIKIEGKPLVLNYMDINCPGCRALKEMMVERHTGELFDFIEVTAAQTQDELVNYFLNEQGGVMKFPTLIAPREFVDKHHLRYTPTMIFINESGYVYNVSGPKGYEDITKTAIDQIRFEFLD